MEAYVVVKLKTLIVLLRRVDQTQEPRGHLVLMAPQRAGTFFNLTPGRNRPNQPLTIFHRVLRNRQLPSEHRHPIQKGQNGRKDEFQGVQEIVRDPNQKELVGSGGDELVAVEF